MLKTSRTSTLRPTGRSLFLASIVASSAALVSVGGCHAEDGTGTGGAAGFGTGTSSGGRTGTSGANGSGGSTTTSSGGSSSSAGGSTSGGSSSSSGGASSTNGGSMNGGSSTGTGGTSAGAGGASGGSMSGGGLGSGRKSCVDLEPPKDPNWPDANCKKWAAETKECTADWFKTYCDVSCGRCTPTGGGMGGATGAAGSSGTAGSTGTAGATGAAGAPAVDCSSAGLPNVTGGNGWASRYWDCCQTHCSQFDGHRCAQDGTSSTGNTTSSCNGGGSFACYDEAPKAVNDCLSYGYIAKANPNCGGCYRIQFTGEGQYDPKEPGSQRIKGKQMIVKVSNTGGDVASNQFDLMVPGGGVGMFNACSKQWGTSDLGAQYGGFLTNCKGDYAARKECVRTNCNKIPAGPARNGCLWFVDWFEIADDPKFTSQSVSCPF